MAKEEEEWPPELDLFVSSHERSHASWQQDISDAKEDYEKLLKHTRKTIKDRDRLSKQVNELTDTKRILTNERNSLTKNKQDLERSNSRLKNAKTRLETTNKQIADEKRRTETELNDANASNRVLNTEVTGLKAQIEGLNTQIDGLNTQLTELTEDKRRSYMAFAIALAVTYVEWVVILIGYLPPDGSIPVIVVLTVVYLAIVTKYFGRSWLRKLLKSPVEP